MTTVDEALSAAWTLSAPARDKSIPFPRGFWPDVARIAAEMIIQQSTTPQLNFRPTMCSSGNYPTPHSPKTKAKSRAENTARLLSGLDLKL